MKRVRWILVVLLLLVVLVVLFVGFFGKQIKGVYTGMGSSLGGTDSMPMGTFDSARQSMGDYDSHARPSPARSPVLGEPSAIPDPAFNTEEYDAVAENIFLDTGTSPLSTLSIDVDTASYSNIRRFILGGSLPPTAGAIRLEEMINYFSYDYAEPGGEIPLAFNTEYSTCPWNEEHRLLLIGLQAEKISFEELPANNLVFLLDVSGSMNSPAKLPLLVSGLKLLVGELRPQDRVAVVVYAGAAGQVLPSTAGDRKRKILDALEKLRAGGSTAGGAGIELAYEIAQEYFQPEGNNRVILATDGDFNVGTSSQSALVELIEKKRESGVYLTVLGFGTGNYSDARMEKLADHGNGNYAYIDSMKEAQKVLVTELGGTLVTVANDVKIQVEFNPAQVASYRLLGYENRVMRTEEFDDDTKDAGELGAGHTVTVLYELVPAGGSDSTAARLKYQTAQLTKEAIESGDLGTFHFRFKWPGENQSVKHTQSIPADAIALAETSENFRFAAAVAEWGMLMRNSQHKGNATYDQALDLAKDARGEDEFGYRSEFLQLVRTSKSLAKVR